MTNRVPLGFEIPTGEPVDLPIKHMVVVGATQEAGKTTCLEGLASRLPPGFKVAAFITKRGEGSFRDGTPLPPYYKERSDWRFVQSLLEAAVQTKLKFETAWIIKSSRGTKTLQEVKTNIDKALETAKGLSESVYTTLGAYLDIVLPQIDDGLLSGKLELNEGTNIFDLSKFSTEMQGLIIASTVEAIRLRENKTIVIIPEIWEFCPEGRKTPVSVALEAFVRKGAALQNYAWLDAQDITGVEKTILKQCENWLLGRQREMNEIKRTLAQIPVAKSLKPKPENIAHLEIGQFFACFGKEVRKVYAQPSWVTMLDAKAIALGRLAVNDALKPAKVLAYEIRMPTLEDIPPRNREDTDLGVEITLAVSEEEDMGRIEELEKQLEEKDRVIADLQTRLSRLEQAKPEMVKAITKMEQPHQDGVRYDMKVTAKVPKMTVEEKVVQIEASTDGNDGRMALLVAKGYFDQGRTVNAVQGEFRQRAWGTWSGGAGAMNMKKLLLKFCEYGFLRWENEQDFQIVPEAKKNITVKKITVSA